MPPHLAGSELVEPESSELNDGHHLRVLVVGPLPPPVHGQSLTGQMIIRQLATRGCAVQSWHIVGATSTADIGVGRARKALRLAAELPRRLREARRFRPTHVIATIGIADSLAVALRDCLVPLLVKAVSGATTVGYMNGLASPELVATQRNRRVLARLLRLFDELVEPYQGSTDAIDPRLSTVVIPFSADVPEALAPLVAGGRVPEDQKTDDRLHVLYLSNLYPQKGAARAIEAVAELRDRGTDVALTIGGGDTPEQTADDLIVLAEQLHVADLVSVLGPVPPDERWSLFAKADVFCLPTDYRAEMLPISLIEALACGVGLVATRWRGIGPTFADCSAAFLIDAPTPTAIADAFATAIDSDLKEVSRDAKEFFARNLSPELFGTRLMEILQSR